MKTTCRYLSWCVALAFALTANAASTIPKPIETPSPGYPPALADSGQKGSATIDIIVKADGSVTDAKVKSADHEAFGEAARTAIERWRFEPATLDGAPIDQRVTVPFTFSPPMTQILNAKFKRKVFQTVSEPVLSEKEYGRKLKATKPLRPAYPTAAKGKTSNVQVRFVVAPDGSTINPELVGNPQKEFMLPAILAVAGAAYEPPVKDGKGSVRRDDNEVELRAAPTRAPPRGGGGGGGGGDFGDGGGGGGFGGGGPPDE